VCISIWLKIIQDATKINLVWEFVLESFHDKIIQKKTDEGTCAFHIESIDRNLDTLILHHK
jgi:hypothetical protein